MNVRDIVSHTEMCIKEGRMLQHGMNFHTAQRNSVILMSRRKGAPYHDRVLEEGRVLIYEGHDIPRRPNVADPKACDQPRRTPSGKLTPNGKFEQAALLFKQEGKNPELVRVYEKIKTGIWTYNGVFRLVDAWIEESGKRKVFRFRLELTDTDVADKPNQTDLEHNRLIPSAVKQEVFKRDKGRCTLCGATDNLHFDHDLPYSKGGTSIMVENVRLLCARHNLQKHDRIE